MTAPFEVLGFTAAAASDDVAVVELTGRFDGAPDARPARLLVEGDGRRVELPATAAARDGATWRATFAVPLDLAERGAYALAMRGMVLDLPDPDRVDDRVAAMARELNRQRRAVEAAEARAAAATADADARATAQVRAAEEQADAALAEARSRADARVGAAEAEANAARGQLAQVERRVAEAEERTLAVRRELDGVRGELDHERAANAAAVAALQQALEASRDETAELRKALKQARAEVEAARREAASASDRAETARAELARTAAVRPRAVPVPVEDALEDDAAEPGEDDDDEVTDERPTAIVRRRDPPTVHQEPIPAGERVERVRVLGRERRAPDPDAPPTPVDAPPLDPPSRLGALFVLALLVGLAIVVLALLLS